MTLSAGAQASVAAAGAGHLAAGTTAVPSNDPLYGDPGEDTFVHSGHHTIQVSDKDNDTIDLGLLPEATVATVCPS